MKGYEMPDGPDPIGDALTAVAVLLSIPLAAFLVWAWFAGLT